MANLNPVPPRLAANQTPRLIFSESNVRRALRTNQRYMISGGSNAALVPVKPNAASCFARDSNAAPAFPAGQRYALCDGSNAVHAFRAETQADFRYTSIQGAVPKW